MIHKDKTKIYLFAIFIIVLTIRLYLAFKVQSFSDDTSYFNLRQVKHISETGYPSYDDNLSYGGRFLIFLPLFHYILAFFNLFLSLEQVGKIIPNIFASLLIFIIFYLTKEVSKDNNSAIMSAFISGFIPIFFSETINTVSEYSVAIPLIFLSTFYLMKLNYEKKYIPHFLTTIFILSFIHTSSFLIVFAMGLNFIILKIQKLEIQRYLVEVFIFCLFFFTWLEFVLFKKAFLDHGIFLLWQNTPLKILSEQFANITVFYALIAIGFIPLMFGLYFAYEYSFKTYDKNIHLLISFGLGVLFLLWLRLIQFQLGLIFLGILLTIGFGRAYNLLMEYIDSTKFQFIKKYVTFSIIILIIFTSIIPSYTSAKERLQEAPSQKTISALIWIKENLPKEEIILSSLKEGHLISEIAERKNFMDSNFIFIKNINQRYDDLNKIYTNQYTTDAVKLLNKYNIKYILFTEKSKSEFSIEKLSFITDSCFEKVYNSEDNTVEIYKSLCKLDES